MERQRYLELDFLRGITLIAMILWHLAWDLMYYYDYPFRLDRGVMYWGFQFIAPTFMLLAGISCSFTRNHYRRAWRVLLFAMVITIGSYFYDPEQAILFGILHFMGVNMLLYPVYRRWPNWLLLTMALLLVLSGRMVAGVDMSHNWLLPLGFRSSTYRSFDYFPLIPYAGYFLTGVVLGRVLYPNGQARFRVPMPPNPISRLGQHSLTVYLVHQPVLWSGLYLLHRWGLI
ncbi:MAG TPA: DUF1624 domain-containing protein [Clostridia bacterium]|nr:DUF1624 domain-containing protein [Clostridia bacterium]